MRLRIGLKINPLTIEGFRKANRIVTLMIPSMVLQDLCKSNRTLQIRDRDLVERNTQFIHRVFQTGAHAFAIMQCHDRFVDA